MFFLAYINYSSYLCGIEIKTETEVMTMDKEKIINRARAIVGDYDIIDYTVCQDTVTITFNSPKHFDVPVDGEIYKSEEEAKEASTFYKTVVYWGDEDRFSPVFYVNCFGDCEMYLNYRKKKMKCLE